MEEKTFIFDAKKDCRVCLQTFSIMCSLFNEAGYGKLLGDCGKIEIEENDGLPMVICEYCIQDMIQAHHFITKCQDTDTKLRLVLLSQNKNEKGEEKCPMNIQVNDVKFELPDNSDREYDDVDYHILENVKEEKNFDFMTPLLQKPKKKKAKKDRKKKKKLSSKILTADLFNYKKYPKRKDNILEQLIAPRKNKQRKHDDEFPRQCTECPLILKTRSTMLIHMVTHTDENPFQCDHCGKCVRSKGTLKAHIIRFHLEDGVRRYLCTECDKRFYRKTDLTVHSRIHSGETPYRCNYCSRKFVQSSSLLRHVRTHTGSKPYHCPECSKAFCTSSELDKHKIKHSNAKTHPCPECGQLYKTRNSLKHHILIHSNPKGNVCDHCGVSFNNRGNLCTHIKRLHSEKSGMCDFCKKEFSNLEDHMRTHTGETPFQCHICNKKYSLKQSLRIHIRKHSDPKKFVCEYEGCPKAFKLKVMLDFHISKYHVKQPTYICRYCGRGFFRLSDIRRHTDMSHVDKEFLSTDDLRKSRLY